MTHNDITAVLAHEPTLAMPGFAIRQDIRPHAQREMFRDARDELLASSEMCTRICEWLGPVPRQKTISTFITSYQIKHHCEYDFNAYVGNGQLIAAAIHLGIPYKQCDKGPNAYFALSRKWWNGRELRGKRRVYNPLQDMEKPS